MSSRLFKRLIRHIFTLPGAVKKHFPLDSMRRIEQAIANSERTHAGQIRFVVETNLEVPDILRKVSGKKRAIEVFSQLRIWDTEQNNGVLIYLLLADHDFEILADRGIHHHVGDEGWEQISQEMEKRFRNQQFEAGILYGIEQISLVLAQHYPSNGIHKNELPNAPVVM